MESFGINLPQSDGYQRVINYYNSLMNNGNTIFYGIFKRNYLTKISIKTILGMDWIIVASMAFYGKVKSLDSTYINISIEGASKNKESLVEFSGLPNYYKKVFWYSVALNILKDILFSQIYKEIHFFNRFTLSIKCFFIIYRNFILKTNFLYIFLKKLLNYLFKFHNKIFNKSI